MGLENTVPRTGLVITMLGAQPSLCSLEAAGRGLRLEEGWRIWFAEGRQGMG